MMALCTSLLLLLLYSTATSAQPSGPSILGQSSSVSFYVSLSPTVASHQPATPATQYSASGLTHSQLSTAQLLATQTEGISVSSTTTIQTASIRYSTSGSTPPVKNKPTPTTRDESSGVTIPRTVGGVIVAAVAVVVLTVVPVILVLGCLLHHKSRKVTKLEKCVTHYENQLPVVTDPVYEEIRDGIHARNDSHLSDNPMYNRVSHADCYVDTGCTNANTTSSPPTYDKIGQLRSQSDSTLRGDEDSDYYVNDPIIITTRNVAYAETRCHD